MSGSTVDDSVQHVKFLHRFSVAVFEELVVSLDLETTLFLLPSFRWRHLYRPCCAEVLYAVAKPYFADF